MQKSSFLWSKKKIWKGLSACWNFKNISLRPLFIIIFRPKMVEFHPYSILTGLNDGWVSGLCFNKRSSELKIGSSLHHITTQRLTQPQQRVVTNDFGFGPLATKLDLPQWSLTTFGVSFEYFHTPVISQDISKSIQDFKNGSKNVQRKLYNCFIPIVLAIHCALALHLLYSRTALHCYTMSEMSIFSPKIMRHFCLLNQWKYDSNIY